MGAATGVGRQVAEADFAGAVVQGGIARVVGGDPLVDLRLQRLGVYGLRRLPANKGDFAFARPVMSLDRHPAQAFAGIANQMPGGVQTRVQGAALCIDPCGDRAGLRRLVDVVHHAVDFLGNAHDLAVTEPAGVERLPAALRVENRRLQDDGKLVFVGCTTEHFQLGRQVVVGKKTGARSLFTSASGFYGQYK